MQRYSDAQKNEIIRFVGKYMELEKNILIEI